MRGAMLDPMPFVPVREVIQNQLMRVPQVKARARLRHSTGVLQDPRRGREVFEELRGIVPSPLADARMLELGPGRGTALMAAACAEGVRAYAAFDVEPYLTAAELPDPRIDYRTDPEGTMPWPPSSFDVVWSRSVLEHVRSPEGLQRQVLDLLAPGGVQVADIDYKDHYQGKAHPEHAYDMLRYSQRTWDLMTSHRSSWVNRLRHSEWIALFEAVGFEVAVVSTREIPAPIEAFRVHRWLGGVSDDDLRISQATFLLTKPATTR